jgi:malonyl-CoA/methylmalonyl-CoA synthetase
MILYTSGTTSRPKGVVTRHDDITAQITTLVEAWGWTRDDRIVLCLPLHHVHGIINVLSCALWSGASCDMLPRFDTDAVWERIGSGGLTLFMAVPTIYVKLIAAWEAAPPERRTQLSDVCRRLRLRPPIRQDCPRGARARQTKREPPMNNDEHRSGHAIDHLRNRCLSMFIGGSLSLS